MQLLETIKCKDGKLFNLEYHQARFNLARMKFFPKAPKLKLEELIEVPVNCAEGLFRCRVVYAKQIEKIEFIPHQYRTVNSIRLIKDNSIEYRNKYTNRKQLQHLYDQRGDCDDILIVQNNCITDSFTANPIFFDGVKWWTPDTPLLPGTQRARLLAENKISVCRITVDDLHDYQKIGLINALQDMNDMPVLPIEKINR
ncbi:aminotransferase class IV [Draconibacterium sp. IB214405]|uniref:aminotransferase class IV n=1 Tax=Draconibacterium sp. IB214405 TaxID=3097352 RepID=UPI002A1743E3|nr:aminotransferase class IV [Draconibacterium sp. IB214405]MDX8339227.1 aminotransferase class IV [Draconibacterium sp. IB214405]